MKQNYIALSASSFSVFLLLSVFLAVNVLSLVFIKEVSANSDGLYCLDTFGASPQITLDESTLSGVVAGQAVTIAGSYDNPFDGDLYDVSIYAGLYKSGSEIPLNWTGLVGSDVVKADTGLIFSNDWVIPSDLESGVYELKLFVDVGYNMIYSRLLNKASSDYTATFSVVASESDTTYLKKDTVSINGAVVADLNSLITLPVDAGAVNLEIGLSNTVSDFTTGEIYIDVYSGTAPQFGQLVASTQKETTLLKDFPATERVNFALNEDDYTVIISHTTVDGEEENIMLALTTVGSTDRSQNIDTVLRYVTIGERNGSPVMQACVTNVGAITSSNFGDYDYEVNHTVSLFDRSEYDVFSSEPAEVISSKAYLGSNKPELALDVSLKDLTSEDLVFLTIDSAFGGNTVVDFSYECTDCDDAKEGMLLSDFKLVILYSVAFIFSFVVLPMFYFYAIASSKRRGSNSATSENTDNNDSI